MVGQTWEAPGRPTANLEVGRPQMQTFAESGRIGVGHVAAFRTCVCTEGRKCGFMAIAGWPGGSSHTREQAASVPSVKEQKEVGQDDLSHWSGGKGMWMRSEVDETELFSAARHM